MFTNYCKCEVCSAQILAPELHIFTFKVSAVGGLLCQTLYCY